MSKFFLFIQGNNFSCSSQLSEKKKLKEKERIQQIEFERKENERLKKELQELHMKTKAYIININQVILKSFSESDIHPNPVCAKEMKMFVAPSLGLPLKSREELFNRQLYSEQKDSWSSKCNKLSFFL